MDFTKYQEAFEKMEYDERTALKVTIPNTKSTVIVTESADIESASDFIARCFQSEDLYQIRCILVQSSVEQKFIQLLKSKLKSLNTRSLDEQKIKLLASQLANYKSKGFDLIHQCAGEDTAMRSAIVRCPRNLIVDDDLPIVSLEVFRTSKEGISFAKCSLSISLWCENVSITYEFINLLPNARQIWLNSSHGVLHPNIPFYNGTIVCDDPEIRVKAVGDSSGSTIQVANNVHFITTFRANTFQTVVIPFGETFAN